VVMAFVRECWKGEKEKQAEREAKTSHEDPPLGRESSPARK